MKYFSGVATDQVQPGDRIIFCLAKEVGGGRDNAQVHSQRNVEYLEREVVQPTGAQVVLYLKSGKHHYCRYEEEGGPRQHITAGAAAPSCTPPITCPTAWASRQEGARSVAGE